MSAKPFPYSRITGTGSFLPGNRVSNEALAARLARNGIETSDLWIVERTGIKARHFARENDVCSDLAIKAARQALEAADCDAASIDLIIVATSTPDMIFPSTACIVQQKLGVKGCPAFDVQAVCSGFVYALTIADSMIRTGAASKALVIGAEVFSRILDFNDSPPAYCSATAPARSCCRAAQRRASWPANCTRTGAMQIFFARRGRWRAARCSATPCCEWTARRSSNWR